MGVMVGVVHALRFDIDGIHTCDNCIHTCVAIRVICGVLVVIVIFGCFVDGVFFFLVVGVIIGVNVRGIDYVVAVMSCVCGVVINFLITQSKREELIEVPATAANAAGPYCIVVPAPSLVSAVLGIIGVVTDRWSVHSGSVGINTSY